MADIANTRQCTVCEVRRPLTDFGKRIGYKDGRRRQCRFCRTKYEQRRRSGEGFVYKPVSPELAHARHLKLKYGLTRDQYLDMLSAQGGTCGICRKWPPHSRCRNLFVDHCHRTGRVRGLLCNRCNLALAKFGDDLPGFLAVVAYLENAAKTPENRHGY